MKKRILFIGLSIGILGLFFIFYRFATRELFFREKVAFGVVIVNEGRNGRYDLLTPRGTRVIDAAGWIIKNPYIYGVCSNGEYFAIDCEGYSITKMASLTQMNLWLRANLLPDYNMSDEENITHLKYGGGKNRKYNGN